MGDEDKKLKQIKIVLSDLHLSDGAFLPGGERNPRESFVYDKSLINLIDYFSKGQYGQDFPVELILNGDIFDFLNVNYKNYRFDFTSEKISLYKFEKILNGHKTVFEKLQQFIKKENKRITFIIGNHDADFFFESIRLRFIEEISQGNEKLKEKINIIYGKQEYLLEGRCLVAHGHQYEPMHMFDYEKPIVRDMKNRKILRLPWGSLFVMNIVYLFKKDRSHIDKIHPLSLYLFLNLFFDPFFTIKIILTTILYYIKTRITLWRIAKHPWKSSFAKFRQFIKNIPLDFQLLDDGEAVGRDILKKNPDLYAVIIGHTHKPKDAIFPDGKIYINTGTWVKSISLDFKHFGRLAKQPFCLLEYYEGKDVPEIGLFEWTGHQGQYKQFVD